MILGKKEEKPCIIHGVRRKMYAQRTLDKALPESISPATGSVVDLVACKKGCKFLPSLYVLLLQVNFAASPSKRWRLSSYPLNLDLAAG